MKTVDAESPQRPMTEEAGVSLNELAYRRFKQALVTRYKPGEYLNTAQVMNDLDMGKRRSIRQFTAWPTRGYCRSSRAKA